MTDAAETAATSDTARTNTDAAPGAGDHDETSVPGLWRTARWFMRWLLAVCGRPGDVVACGLLTRRERRDIGRWLRPVEAIVRRLVVAEAAQMAADLSRGRQAGNRPPRPPMCRIAFQNPEDSSAWTVRFALTARTGKPSVPRRRARRIGHRPPAPDRCDNQFERMRRLMVRVEMKSLARKRPFAFPPDAAPAAPARQGPAPAPLFSPWPLAQRIEAVRRVLEDSAPHVKRLARRLARRRGGYARRIARACNPPPERPRHARSRFGESSIRHAAAHALAALASFAPG